MIRPTPRLWRLGWLWLALAVAATLEPSLTAAWWAGGALAFGLVAVDGAALVRRPRITARREVPGGWSVGRWEEVRLVLENRGRGLVVELFDHHPPWHACEGMPCTVRVGAGAGLVTSYRLRPVRRGAQSFGAVDARVAGPLGLLRRRLFLGEPEAIRVFPDFRPVARYAFLALDDRLGLMGVHVRRRRGDGMDFHQLREYREGDVLRQVDWKATARRRKLMSREYQVEQDQQVVFLVDCGRRLRAAEEPATSDGLPGLSHFDHVLNALVLLTWVAVRQGDAVGLMTFSGPERWVPPRAGSGALPWVLEALVDLEPTLAPSDYREAAQRLAARQRRRALVVVVTNLRDEDAPELLAVLATLGRRHRVLVASLREVALREARIGPAEDLAGALRVAAAWQETAARERVVAEVRARGAAVVDCEPQDLPVALVDRYLAMKRAGAAG